jgi:hypothetical protein
MQVYTTQPSYVVQQPPPVVIQQQPHTVVMQQPAPVVMQQPTTHVVHRTTVVKEEDNTCMGFLAGMCACCALSALVR